MRVGAFVGAFLHVCVFVGTKMYTRICAYESYISMYVIMDVISTYHHVAPLKCNVLCLTFIMRY